VQAAINAVHTEAVTAAQTDWRQVVALYDQLLALAPTPVARLNRAVAVAEVEGPEVGLGLVEGLAGDLAAFHSWHVARAELLRRLGRADAARGAYEQALALTGNARERDHLRARLESLPH
jgi:RNA polymerase sigma-70 factor (ECF subfamily)